MISTDKKPTVDQSDQSGLYWAPSQPRFPKVEHSLAISIMKHSLH